MISPAAVSSLTDKDLMTADPLVLKEEDDLGEASRIMLAHRIRGLPVVNAEGRLTGISQKRTSLNPLRKWLKFLSTYFYDKKSIGVKAKAIAIYMMSIYASYYIVSLEVLLFDGLTCAESLGCCIIRSHMDSFDNCSLDMGVYV